MSTLSRFIKYIKTSSPSGKESDFAALLIKELRALKLKPYRDKIGNIYADIKGDGKKSDPILLNAHIDTVVHDEKIRPRVKNGIITSSGNTILGADNKAGVAVIMETLQIIKEKKIHHPDIQIIFTVQEEIGLKGAKQLRRGWIYPKTGYVLDGGDVDTIYYKAPSQKNITAEILGRAAHAGVHPEQGINAIKVASEAIAKMKIGRIDFETTANIGVIEGGKATNIIPDRVLIKGEARSHKNPKLKIQTSKMVKAIKKTCKKHKAEWKIKIEDVYESFSVDADDPVVRKAKRVLIGLKIKPELKATGGGSDANVFNKMGIKTVIIGVGADNVHTSRERIAIKDINLGAQCLLRIISNA